jgi:peptidyl-prolyl cis-trans isomerase C
MRRPSTRSRAPEAARAVVIALTAIAAIAACDSKKQAPEATSQPSTAAAPKAEAKNGLTREQAKKVLVKVGDTTITLGDFAERLSSQSPYLRARYASPERRREFLDNMVRFELLALEAKKRGHEQQADVERVRRQMMVQQMMKEVFDDKGIKLSDITDAEIKTYYDAHQAEFHKPAQRRVSHILWTDKVKDRAKAEATLKQLQAKVDDMELFRTLAKEQNQDPETKDREGDLRFFAREPQADEPHPPKAVRDAAFTLAKIGEVFPKVIESEQGLHVIKLTGDRAALDRSAEDARRLIQNRLWREKREAAIDKFVADLRAKADVKENLDLLGQVRVDATAAPGGDPDADEDAEEKAVTKKPAAPSTAPAGAKVVK